MNAAAECREGMPGCPRRVAHAAGAGPAGSGTVAGEHPRGTPAVQLHQAPFRPAPAEPGAFEMVPEPARVHPYPAPAAPAGDHLADPAGSHRPPAVHTGPQLRPMTLAAPRADADAPVQAAGGCAADLDDPGRAALTAAGDLPLPQADAAQRRIMGGTGCRPSPAAGCRSPCTARRSRRPGAGRCPRHRAASARPAGPRVPPRRPAT